MALSDAEKKFIEENNIEAISPEDVKDQITGKSPLMHSLRNIGAGFANPLISAANLVPESLNPILRKLGAHHDVLPVSPPLRGDYNPSSLGYLGGEIASNILPYVGAEKGILTGAKFLPSAVEKLASATLPRTALAGAITGGLTSPTGERERGAALGSVFSPLSALLGESVGGGLKSLVRSPSAQKLGDLVQPYLGNTENPVIETAEKISENYKNLRSLAQNKYHQIFNALSGEKMGMEDLSHYERALDVLKEKKGMEFPDSDDLEKKMGGRSSYSVHGLIKKGISPSEVNKIRSNLLKNARHAYVKNEKEIGDRYSKLGEALHTDMEKYLQKYHPNLWDDYRDAQSFYKTKIVPFQEHPGSKQILKSLQAHNALDSDNGTEILTQLGKDISPTSLVPASSSQNVNKLKDLSLLLQSPEGIPNKELAANLAKGIMFEKAAPIKGAPFNMDKYIQRYNKLSSDQKGFLFSPLENQILQGLQSYKEASPKGIGKSISDILFPLLGGAAIGSMVGHGLGHGAEGVFPELAGGALGILERGRFTDALNNLLTHLIPSSPQKLLNMLAPYEPSKVASTLMPAVGGGLANIIGGRNA